MIGIQLTAKQLGACSSLPFLQHTPHRMAQTAAKLNRQKWQHVVATCVESNDVVHTCMYDAVAVQEVDGLQQVLHDLA